MMVERTLLRGWLVDDAYISLRHAKNVVEANGLVYDAGELPMGRAVSASVPFAANGTHVYYARVFWHATADVAVASLDVR